MPQSPLPLPHPNESFSPKHSPPPNKSTKKNTSQMVTFPPLNFTAPPPKKPLIPHHFPSPAAPADGFLNEVHHGLRGVRGALVALKAPPLPDCRRRTPPDARRKQTEGFWRNWEPSGSEGRKKGFGPFLGGPPCRSARFSWERIADRFSPHTARFRPVSTPGTVCRAPAARQDDVASLHPV